MDTGRSRSRSARPALFALLATAALGCGPDETAPISNLEFFATDDNHQPTTLLDYKLTTPGLSYGWPQNRLSSKLTQHPLDHVQVRYFSHDTLRTEAHLFPFDPAARADELRAISAKELAGIYTGAAWDALFADPEHSTKVTLPWDVVVPFPNKDVTEGDPFPLDRAEVFLGPSKFVDGPPHKLFGAVAKPKGGSVKAARVYDHGTCSRELPLEPWLDTELDGLLDELTAEMKQHDSGYKRIVHYAHGAVYLDHGDPDTPTDLRDGVFFDLHLTFKVPGYAETHVWAFLQAQFILTDGLLDLHYDTLEVKADHDFGATPVENAVVEQWTKALLDDIADRLWQEGYDPQHVDAAGVFGPCDPRDADPCVEAGKQVESLIRSGAQYVHDYTFSESDVDTMSAVVKQPERWSCVKDPVKEGNVCLYFTPVKRLNVYPDAVESVWFDGKDIHNPAFALWVASFSQDALAPLTNALAAMCQWQPTHAHDEFYHRNFAWVRR